MFNGLALGGLAIAAIRERESSHEAEEATRRIIAGTYLRDDKGKEAVKVNNLKEDFSMRPFQEQVVILLAACEATLKLAAELPSDYYKDRIIDRLSYALKKIEPSKEEVKNEPR